MPRQARVVIPGIAHHITQRGNRRQPVFFCDDDYQYYLDLLGTWTQTNSLAILAYCLMPNHIHLIVRPTDISSMAKSMNEIHRRYTRYINFREKWTGHLWQSRYSSFALSDRHLYHALRYVETNPVRASLVEIGGHHTYLSVNWYGVPVF